MYDHLPTLQPALYKVYHQANITKITDPYKQTKLTHLFKSSSITSVGGGA